MPLPLAEGRHFVAQVATQLLPSGFQQAALLVDSAAGVAKPPAEVADRSVLFAQAPLHPLMKGASGLVEALLPFLLVETDQLSCRRGCCGPLVSNKIAGTEIDFMADSRYHRQR